MKPMIHSKLSVKRYGGKPEDYLPIHDMMDISKSALADVRHRAILHNSLGPYLMEHIFGTTITNSDNTEVCVRDIAEDHIMEDLGRIPTIEQWLKGVKVEAWMAGGVLKYKKMMEQEQSDSNNQVNLD